MLNTANKKMNNNKLDAIKLYQEHKRRLEGISTSKKLLDLMLEVQRHRAASLATLGGDVFFENRLWSIQKAITKYIAELGPGPQKLLTEQEQHQLYGEWVTIRSQWQKDTVIQNFLLHSHLIDLILKINTNVCVRSGQTQLNEEHQALSDYGMHHLPILLEAAAQARGLATHCAAQSTNSERFTSRIRYLINQITLLDERAQATIVNSSPECYRIIQQARTRNNCEHYMSVFLTRLKEHFTTSDKPNLFSDEIYTTGSQFIMANYDILLRTYKLMSKNMDSDMEEWIYRSSYNA